MTTGPTTTRPITTGLPQTFSALAAFESWALPTETLRNQKRVRSSQPEIDAFANSMLDRVDEIGLYLNGFALDAMPEPARRLYFMLLSLAEVAPSFEGFRQPIHPDGYDPAKFRATEDAALRPPL